MRVGGGRHGYCHPHKPADPAVAASTPLICLIDSDPATRRSVHTLLRELGAELEVFDSAEDFLASTVARRPVCLIADSRLPGMSAHALLLELRNRGFSIPTILLSSADDVAAAVSAMQAGALDYIEKPHIAGPLASHVAKVLDRNEQPR